MEENERLIPHVERLASLLGDERGAEILAELQKLAIRGRRSPRQDPPPADGMGVWDVIDTPDGPGLRRQSHPPAVLRMWANVAEVAGKGTARRVVLVGESSARGFLLDPVLTPSLALASHLRNVADPGTYQCIDLAQTGAALTDIVELLTRLPLADPDVLVLYAGNNWSVPLYSVADLDALSAELRSGGYAAMQQAFWPRVVLPAARALLAHMDELLSRGVDVVVVIPEFNLREWRPPENVEVPVLPPGAFIEWHQLRDAAEAALDAQRWDAVLPLTSRMRQLDEGCSPMTGCLLGRALEALGDGAGARQAYEDSRDSVCGLPIRHTPRATRNTQDLLAQFCIQRGLRCVDLRRLLAADDLPELPDVRHFLDFCHLSDSGIDILAGAVAEAITGSKNGAAGRHALESRDRAATHVMAACYNAYSEQPAPVLRRHLREAADACPASLELMAALRDVLEGAGPLWTNPRLAMLTQFPQVDRYLEMLVGRRAESLGLWTLRACLDEFLPELPPCSAQPRLSAIELLEVPEGPPGLGHRAPNYTPGSSFIRATSRRTRLHFSLATARSGAIEITYRMNGLSTDSPARVKLDHVPIGTLPFVRKWSTVRLLFATEAARVNELEIQWPVAAVDYDDRRRRDVLAMAQGEYPFVLPVFGEIATVRIS